MFVYDKASQYLEIGPPLFEGGEGVICTLRALPGHLAKLYRPEKRDGKEGKLAWMIANPPVDPGRAAGYIATAWPETLLYEGSGSFVGYAMPYIANAKTLLHVINPSLRRRTLPGFDQRYLHRVARNLATALRDLHDHDYVIGDLNETNVLVAQTALVTVIDADSFQVKEKHTGQITFYPCPVGRPEYTPPELQGRSFVNEVRQPEQDTFALAVLIFQLLMDGSHPFRSIWLGGGDSPPVEEKILQGWFPYAPAPNGKVKPPPGLSLDRLHPSLAGLMLRCFIDGQANPRQRPSAADWESALVEAEKALATCPCGHIYVAHLGCCPRCGANYRAVNKASLARSKQSPVNNPTSPASGAHPPLINNTSPMQGMQPTAIDIVCSVCGTSNPHQRVYCLKCAVRLHPMAACPHCAQVTAQGAQAKYCEHCGRRL